MFGNNLKRIRKEKGWTQGELTLATGIKVTHIPNLENNRTDPKLSTIKKLIDALECTPNELLENMNNRNSKTYLKNTVEKIEGLPEDSQKVVIDLIEKYCLANEFKKLMKQ